MCGKPKVDTSYQDFSRGEAERARGEEDQRQARIAEGMKQIQAVFEGGSYAAPQEMPSMVEAQGIANPDYVPATQAGNGDQRVQTAAVGAPMISSVPGRAIGELYTPEVGARGAPKTFEGMQSVLDQRRSAMEGFYIPQLDKQFEGAQDDLTFALSRSGQLTSSVAGDKQGDLSDAFALNRTKIDADIAGDVASTKSRMNQQRQSLEAGLRASGDATASSNAALQSAVTFRDDAPTLNPIGNIFFGLSQGIGAAKQGFESGRIRKLATPNPLGSGTGRVVRT
jgi:hypothetical protein